MEVLKAVALGLLLVAPAFGAATFPVHSFHAAQLGRLDCNLCHKSSAKGSVQLRRPGHEECKACHANAFSTTNERLCGVCHNSPGKTTLRAFPRDAKTVVAEFSHTKHADPKARNDPHTGLRADCTFCHKFAPGAMEPLQPGHSQCASCHSKPGMPAQLTPMLRTTGCLGCHQPDETVIPTRAVMQSPVRFSHAAHLQAQHDGTINCTNCHRDAVKVDENQCAGCHSAMRPASHTARWRDDLHGNYAALDRTTCATCHMTDYCSRCHNELPRTHAPLPMFKNGGHARSAIVNERACFTCHTFQNTCAQCHLRQLR